MSSLLSKLKSLVSARARGPRRYRKEPEPRAEAEVARTPLPEVTEAPAQRQKLPEVMEAPEADEAPAREVIPISGPASRIEEPKTEEKGAEALEEERIVDLLKGQKS